MAAKEARAGLLLVEGGPTKDINVLADPEPKLDLGIFIYLSLSDRWSRVSPERAFNIPVGSYSLPVPDLCGFSAETVTKLGIGRVRPVTARFVLGLAATAQGHAITNFVSITIGANERDTSPHPQRAATLLHRILDYSD